MTDTTQMFFRLFGAWLKWWEEFWDTVDLMTNSARLECEVLSQDRHTDTTEKTL